MLYSRPNDPLGYLADLCAVRRAGMLETFGFPALSNLLNAIGGELTPKITRVNRFG